MRRLKENYMHNIIFLLNIFFSVMRVKTRLGPLSPNSYTGKLNCTVPSTTISTIRQDKSMYEPALETDEVIIEHEEGIVHTPSNMRPKLKGFNQSLFSAIALHRCSGPTLPGLSYGMKREASLPAGRCPKRAISTNVHPLSFKIGIYPIKSRNRTKVPGLRTVYTPVKNTSSILVTKSMMCPKMVNAPVDGMRTSSSPKRRRTKSSVQCVAFKMQTAAHNRLQWLLEKKRKLEEKYRNLMSQLSLEQAFEINHNVEKLSKGSNEQLQNAIQNIKEEYSITRGLLEQQRIVEEGELLEEYQNKIKEGIVYQY